MAQQKLWKLMICMSVLFGGTQLLFSYIAIQIAKNNQVSVQIDNHANQIDINQIGLNEEEEKLEYYRLKHEQMRKSLENVKDKSDKNVKEINSGENVKEKSGESVMGKSVDNVNIKSGENAENIKSSDNFKDKSGENTKLNTKTVDKNIESSTFLTICTTFSENEEMRFQVQNNTLLNWNYIKSNLKTNIVVYSNSTEHAENCKTFDCDISPLIPQLTISKRPMLREMFLDMEKRYASKFYGYCNGDILFNGKELKNTFEAILNFAEQNFINGYLILGSRHQVNFQHFRDGKREFKKINIGDENEIMELTKTENSFIDKHRGAYDFFFARKSGFPWAEIPPFVVSQAGFDSWMMIYANKMEIPVIDVTNTLTAVHQYGAVKQQENQFYINTHSHNHAVFWSSLLRANSSMFVATCALYKTIYDQGQVKVVQNMERDANVCVYKYKIQIPDPNNDFYQQLGVLPYD
ncbi:unnamed protein product, partial [Owenia fusiformis]